MICALLSWFDEPPNLLEQAIRSAAAAGCEALAAYDGRYAQFAAHATASPPEQAERIRTVAGELGLRARVEVPRHPWATEADKRSALFELGERATTGRDWYLILDADYLVTADPAKLGGALEATGRDVATVTLAEPAKRTRPHRGIFRAVRGLYVRGNHYTYATPNGRIFWGGRRAETLEPAVDVTELCAIAHLHDVRPEPRLKAQAAYYVERDRAGVERGACDFCDVEQSIGFILGDWRLEGDGRPSGTHLEVCAACLPAAVAANVAVARDHGIDVAQAVKLRNRTADARARVEEARAACRFRIKL